MAENAGGGSAVARDEAQLSSSQDQLHTLALQAMQLPEVRSQRVQSLREAIQSGQYQREPAQIAEAMLVNSVISGRN